MKIKHIIWAAVMPLIIFPTVNTQAEHDDTFIIKYNEYGLAHYAEDRFFPYDFADAERVDALMRADALEWYEADREIELAGYAPPEQIRDGIDGLIFENSEDGLYTGLKRLLTSPGILEELKTNVAGKDYGNEKDIKYFDKLIDNILPLIILSVFIS